MQIDLNKFNELVDQKYLRKVISPCGKLALFTYTDKCTFERYWTKETRMARGLIVEIETGVVVAKPFEKFFNLGESEETYLANLPKNLNYTVLEKLDGSLGIVYYYDGKWDIATKGSFTSEQAIKAQEMLKNYKTNNLNTRFTYLVEIIYPENKIVVDYNKEEKLVLLQVVDTKTGHEYRRYMNGMEANLVGFSYTELYDYSIEQMIELQKTLPKDQEGFVVRYENGLRLKIKGEEYLRIHKMISHMTPLAFWEVMKDGKVPVEYLQQLPEEFRPEFEAIVSELEKQYKTVYFETLSETLKLPTRQNDQEARKQIGLYLKENPGKHPQAMFMWVNEKQEALEKYCMKQIRPKANEFKEI